MEVDGRPVAPVLLVRKAVLCGPSAQTADAATARQTGADSDAGPQLFALTAPHLQLHQLQRAPPRCATASRPTPLPLNYIYKL